MTFAEPGITDIPAAMEEIRRQVLEADRKFACVQSRAAELNIEDVRQVRQSAREMADEAMAAARAYLEIYEQADRLVKVMR